MGPASFRGAWGGFLLTCTLLTMLLLTTDIVFVRLHHKLHIHTSLERKSDNKNFRYATFNQCTTE